MTLHFSSDIAAIDTVSPSKRDTQKIHRSSSSGPYRKGLKRVLDVALTLMAAPFVLPMVGLMALLIALDGHNPFYSQLRVGRQGRTFRMWKLRSMVHKADEMLEAYLAENPAARAEWDATQKLKNDPRITLVGRIIRKTSMDELPQLWNVLNGTMSLVGPRPMMLSQKSTYFGEAYYRLRPGITGIWQTSDRNNCDFVDRVGYDEQYDQTLTFKADVHILLRTVTVVLRATGY